MIICWLNVFSIPFLQYHFRNLPAVSAKNHQTRTHSHGCLLPSITHNSTPLLFLECVHGHDLACARKAVAVLRSMLQQQQAKKLAAGLAKAKRSSSARNYIHVSKWPTQVTSLLSNGRLICILTSMTPLLTSEQRSFQKCLYFF